jgi:alpha-dioxygenase
MLVLSMHFRVPMENLIGIKGEKALLANGFTKQLVSMGHQACGAFELWNYPTFVRDLVVQDINIHDRPA